jgi:hypothetical protein
MPSFTPGRLYRRTELHDEFGGQRQGGISTPAKHPFVILITGESGKQHGYADKWSDEGHFLYSGEGQRGDMQFVAGNKSVRDHAAAGKTIHLFEQSKKDKRFLRYIGEMKYVGHHLEPAPDTDGKPRQAIIFHLQPVTGLAPDTPTLEAALASEMPQRRQNKGGGFGSAEHNRHVEQAAVKAVRRDYETRGWTVKTVETEKLGYDLRCTRGGDEEHVEVKGTQADEVCFIVTAGEVRNALIDSKHVTCVVTEALSNAPRIHRFDKTAFLQLELDPIAYRARPKG